VTVKNNDNKIQIGDLSIDLEARRVFMGEADLHLTRTEYSILSELAHRMDSIVTHDELIIQVWGPEYRGSNHYLHNYLGRLRKKLGDYGDILETVPGMGYNLHSKKIF
jgi:two-component system KDP operon response regulator KdpE